MHVYTHIRIYSYNVHAYAYVICVYVYVYEVLKYGAMIVDALVEYKQPVTIYIPPNGVAKQKYPGRTFSTSVNK